MSSVYITVSSLCDISVSAASPFEYCLQDGLTRSSEIDGRSYVTDCFDLQFVLTSAIGL